MSESKFTKGPWQRDKYGTVIANGNTLLVTGVAMPCGYKKGEPEANANLIAAAPEMYEMLGVALVEIQSLIDECNASRLGKVASQTLTEPDLIDGETCFRIQELLAKARGEL